MSKKKEDKKTVEEEVKTEETSEETPKKEIKEEPKKSSKKTSKKNKVKKKEKNEVNLPLRTLIDLVEESGIRRKEIIVRLANKGYLGQFYDEEEKRRIGYPIEPTISENEFKKIIGE